MTYPEPFTAAVRGRHKRPLGDVFGLRNVGVNLTRLAPGSASALRHAHTRQDEFVYAHQLVNRSPRDAVFLEVGDRSAGDAVAYPHDDLVAKLVDGAWRFTRKDGTPY